ncbi:MAG: PAS domain S-box protein [Leptolyngbya sp. DLM2.Bin27]|nr:MAG: PAS domain S-box protein [Leptolyngbya sp. DLM2.Bin27]
MAQFQSQTKAVDSLDTAALPIGPAVLLLSDRSEQARLGRAAPPTYQLLTADDLSQALALWRTGTVTWVLLDLSWPGGSGLDFLTTLGAGGGQRPLPVTVLVDPGQERTALEAMKRGAADYQFKPELTPERLWASLSLESSRLAQPLPPLPNALEQARQHCQNLAEAKLKKSETHLRLAQRIGNLGSWEFELATEQVTWSDQVYRIFGLPLGKPPDNFEAIQNYIHPDDRDRHRQIVEAAVAHHQPYDAEFCIVCADGSLGYIQAKGEPMVNAAGQITHLIGTVLDIGDRKRREAQRQQAEAQLQSLSFRLRLALESANIGTWERSVSTGEVIWDQCLVDLYGFGKLDRSATYADWQAKVYADDLDRVEASHQALLDHDIPYDIEFRIWRGDGSLGWIRSSAVVRRDAQGQALSVIGINYDITERKRAAVELQHLSERLSLALKSGGFGSWEFDLSSGAISWDQQLIRLYGLAHLQQPITYSEWQSRVHQDDLPVVEAAIRAAIDTNAPYDTAFRIWRGGGELRWIKSNGLVRHDAQGRPTSMIGINYDITERKRAEQQILRTTAQLEASNRELEAFAYSVSHDLRAPLRAIDGFSRALIEDYGDQFGDEGRDYFNRIRHNVSRMGQLIDDLLRLSQVSRSTMAYAPVDLSTLVQEQIDDLTAADPDRVVTVAITPGITVSADPTLMRVAIANLVQNAWKFTAHHPTAALEFGVAMKQGEPIYYLRDDGAGFDMTYANKLFGAFQRLHSTDEFPGTGIGLATVQRAIHRHGGRVWAEAVVEQGATFYFTLPSAQPALEVQL